MILTMTGLLLITKRNTNNDHHCRMWIHNVHYIHEQLIFMCTARSSSSVVFLLLADSLFWTQKNINTINAPITTAFGFTCKHRQCGFYLTNHYNSTVTSLAVKNMPLHKLICIRTDLPVLPGSCWCADGREVTVFIICGVLWVSWSLICTEHPPSPNSITSH